MSYAPVASSTVGTLTTTVTTGFFSRMGRWILLECDVAIVTAGTGAGGLLATIPITALSGSKIVGAGQEIQALGITLTTVFNTLNQLIINKYDNTTVIASGRTTRGSILYPTA